MSTASATRAHGPDKRLAETVLRKRKVEIAEGKFMDKRRPVTTTLRSWLTPIGSRFCPDEAAGIPRAQTILEEQRSVCLGATADSLAARR